MSSLSAWGPTIVVCGQPISTYYPSYTPYPHPCSWPMLIAPPTGQDLFIAWCPGLMNSHVVPGSAHCVPVAPLPAYVQPSQPAVSVTYIWSGSS